MLDPRAAFADRSGVYVGKILHHSIVIHDSASREDASACDPAMRIHDRPGRHHRSRRYARRRRNISRRMDEGRDFYPSFFQSDLQILAHGIVPDPHKKSIEPTDKSLKVRQPPDHILTRRIIQKCRAVSACRGHLRGCSAVTARAQDQDLLQACVLAAINLLFFCLFGSSIKKIFAIFVTRRRHFRWKNISKTISLSDI